MSHVSTDSTYASGPTSYTSKEYDSGAMEGNEAYMENPGPLGSPSTRTEASSRGSRPWTLAELRLLDKLLVSPAPNEGYRVSSTDTEFSFYEPPTDKIVSKGVKSWELVSQGVKRVKLVSEVLQKWRKRCLAGCMLQMRPTRSRDSPVRSLSDDEPVSTKPSCDQRDMNSS